MSLDENGNEIHKMTKEEANASVEEMGNMMDYFNETCERCGEKRMNCSMECLEKGCNNSAT